MKKRPYLHADAHVLARARLTPDDYAQINAPVKDHINAINAHEASLRSAPQHARSAAQAMPPPSNTGGKIEIRLENGKVKQLLPRKHYDSKVCFIDWVNVTFHEDTFQVLGGAVTDQEIVMAVSMACESVFGFGITSKRDKGANFYHTSFVLGENYGMVCYGGQRNTVLITLNGEGCTAARGGWERRLYDLLKSSTGGKITRIDLSHDDIEGKHFTVDSLEKSYLEGAFNNGGRDPDIELRGNWKNPNGKGRTVYVGHRTNGLFFRGYEKGKQLGDPDSMWIRLEIEIKSVDRIVPYDILKYPHEYYAAAYPLLRSFSADIQRIDTVKKTTEVTYARTKKWLKRQCGSAINLMLNIEGSAQAVLDLIIREGKLPKGILPPSFVNVSGAFHHTKPDYTPLALSFLSPI